MRNNGWIRKAYGYLLSIMIIFSCAACHPGQKTSGSGEEREKITALLEKVRKREQPLSACITEALPIAGAYNDRALLDFCRNELLGYDEDKDKEYRFIEVFCPIKDSVKEPCKETFSLFRCIERHPEQFRKKNVFVIQAITVLEKVKPVDQDRSFIKLTHRNNDDLAYEEICYARGNTYLKIIETVRLELIRRLEKLLAASLGSPF